MDPFVPEAQAWAATQFGAADLHDKRLTDRLVYLATQITAHPSGSFPEQTESWNDLRAAYNLFDGEEVTFQAIAWYRSRIRQRFRSSGRQRLLALNSSSPSTMHKKIRLVLCLDSTQAIN
jgi:Transposase DNA-binding